MKRENTADILCIGAQRSMTSWLHHVLAVHPETWAFPDFEPLTSTRKEAHFWDRNHERGAEWYQVLLRPLQPHAKSMDFTPEYAFLDEGAVAECKALNPTAQVIYILRDPLARAVSALRMHTMWATGSAGAENHAITYGQEFLDRCDHAWLTHHGDYVANATRWRQHYPDMLILNYEELAADPVGAADRILTACDLSPDAFGPDQRAEFETRARHVNWPTHKYPFDADCLHFLQGMFENVRKAVVDELGIEFSEGERLMEGIA